MKPFAAIAVAAATLALVACGSDKKTIDVSSEEALVEKGLAHTNAQAKSIDCEGGVEAKVGNTATCHAKLTNGQTANFTLRVDRIDDNGGGHMTIVAANEQ
jgi:hypothetical protein